MGQGPSICAALAPGLAATPLVQLQTRFTRMGSKGMKALAEAVGAAGCPWRHTLRVLLLAGAAAESSSAQQQAAELEAFACSLNELVAR